MRSEGKTGKARNRVLESERRRECAPGPGRGRQGAWDAALELAGVLGAECVLGWPPCEVAGELRACVYEIARGLRPCRVMYRGSCLKWNAGKGDGPDSGPTWDLNGLNSASSEYVT